MVGLQVYMGFEIWHFKSKQEYIIQMNIPVPAPMKILNVKNKKIQL